MPIEEEPEEGRQTWLEKGFELTDSLLSWCKANEIYLILDLHAASGGQGTDVNISDRDQNKPSLWESDANKQKTVALWRKLANRHKNEAWIGGYDIINEPNWGFTNYENDKNGLAEKENTPLRKLLMEITAAIREVDNNHIIIIEGNGWGNNYNGIFPLWDDNMVISFHKYWNYNDSTSISNALRMREEQNAPVWLGESGENSNVWFTQAIELVESHNIGWAWWQLKKLGFNNPLEIQITPEYEQLLNYWNGNGKEPSGSAAYQTLMALAKNARLENCFYHKDVIDAMFRQVYSLETIPFKKHQLSSSLVINAVDYDLGRNGFAYYDTDTANYYISTGEPRTGWNLGRTYRDDGVDIYESTSGDEYYIVKINAGEWLQYTITAESEGLYVINIDVSSDKSDGKFSLYDQDILLAENVPVPNTDGLENWHPVEISAIQLEKGIHKIRFYAKNGGFQLRSLLFTLVRIK